MVITRAWRALLLAHPVVAVLTNHTIDDAGPLVRYLPSAAGLCVGCAAQGEFASTFLTNGTVTNYADTGTDVRAIEILFTGSAIYIFLAAPNLPDPFDQQCSFALDHATVGSSFLKNFPASTDRYNILAYENTSIPDGPHTFQIHLSLNTAVYFDYAVYTSNDPHLTPSASATTFTTTIGAPPALIEAVSKKKPPIAAIVGGIVAFVAATLAFLATLILCRHPRNRNRVTPPVVEELSLPPLGGAILPWVVRPSVSGAANPADLDAIALVDEVRRLREQVQRLETKHGEAGSSSAGSETGSLSRSMSMMKREQTRVVLGHQEGFEGDSLVHTDSGLRLTAGRMLHELPPTYAPG
ncbi:hypothetical protein FB451DRAFT_735623 [Mycena latifolia]|nr:hypothetical protein FB451DRAFT_735623 [Mycena latifolia]